MSLKLEIAYNLQLKVRCSRRLECFFGKLSCSRVLVPGKDGRVIVTELGDPSVGNFYTDVDRVGSGHKKVQIFQCWVVFDIFRVRESIKYYIFSIQGKVKGLYFNIMVGV